MKNSNWLFWTVCLLLLPICLPIPAAGAQEPVSGSGIGEAAATPAPSEILAGSSLLFLPLLLKGAGDLSPALLSVLINHFLLFVPSPAP